MRTNTRKRFEDRQDVTTNNEGGVAFNLSPKERLYQRVLTCLFGEDKFYGNQDKSIISDLKLVAKTDPEYILKLASYARNEMYLRTIPQVLLVEAAQLPEFKGTGLIKQYTGQIVQRVDEITEVLAYQLEKHGKPLPNSLIRGLKHTFGKFDAYQFAKYEGKRAKVKLKDAVRIVHPKPVDKEREVLYKKIVDGTLEAPETWEHVIMTKGSNKETWEGIIPKMGYMALLRNLRNFNKHGVNIDPVIKKLVDPEQVKRSKQYPFRFYAAYKELEKSGDTPNEVMSALSEAMTVSAESIKTIPGKTFLSSDLSGSMESQLSSRGVMRFIDIAALMQAIAARRCEKSMTSAFGQDFKVVPLDPKAPILYNTEKIIKTNVGHSTNGYLAIKHLNYTNTEVDRILIFTDEEMYDSRSWYGGGESFKDQWETYKRKYPNTKLYVFNLAGYGITVVPPNDKNVSLISGWSDKVFQYIELFESDKKKMIDTITNYEGPVVRA